MLGLDLTHTRARSAVVNTNDAASATTKQTQTMASSGSQSSSSSTDVSNITGADFLTLLVSELKNQDPTKPTDPEQYVQQLVGVNSLQQLIQINQDLGGNAGGTTKH